MLDVDHSGLIDFDEFYVLICILLAVRVSIGHGVKVTEKVTLALELPWNCPRTWEGPNGRPHPFRKTTLTIYLHVERKL
jgi:hypothetical protein